jgi:SAM-dependent methyltransferase
MGRSGSWDRGVSGIVRRSGHTAFTMIGRRAMTDVEAVVQRYYGDRPIIQRIVDALRSAGVDPQRPSHRDLWPFDQLHSRGIVATREHAERAGIQAGMYVLDIGCGLGGASRYLAVECSCRVAAIDLTPNFVEAARILTARCGLAERIEFRKANALALPFQDGTFDHAGRMPSP